MSNVWAYMAQFSLGIWYNRREDKIKEEIDGRHKCRK